MSTNRMNGKLWEQWNRADRVKSPTKADDDDDDVDVDVDMNVHVDDGYVDDNDVAKRRVGDSVYRRCLSQRG